MNADIVFWERRINQQVEYIAKFNIEKRTRPDAQDVLDSALFILEQCQMNLLKCKDDRTQTGAKDNS